MRKAIITPEMRKQEPTSEPTSNWINDNMSILLSAAMETVEPKEGVEFERIRNSVTFLLKKVAHAIVENSHLSHQVVPSEYFSKKDLNLIGRDVRVLNSLLSILPICENNEHPHAQLLTTLLRDRAIPFLEIKSLEEKLYR